MPREYLGSAVLELVTDPTKLRAGMEAARVETLATVQGAQKALTAVGTNLATTGRQFTAAFTLPVVAAGKAIYDVSSQYEESLDHIVGLAGVAREELERWKPALEDLAEETGKGPRELAEALYFIASAGLKGEAAMDALRASARAAAAGLGSTAVVADAVTSAVNAYAKSGLTASQATDVLVSAVREGKAEASAFAPVLGRLLPTASAMNISFSQVAGTLAVMTRTGLDAAEASTSLSAIMSFLLKSGTQARETLAGVGLTLEQLRDVAAREPDGLIQAMRLLDTAFTDNDEALAKVVPNIRAFRGVMNVLAQDAGSVNTVLQNVADSAGMTAEALQAVQESAKFKVDVALARLQFDLIRLGEDVLPVVVELFEEVAGAVRTAVRWFKDLPAPMRETVIRGLAIIAMLGPLLVILGTLSTALGGIIGLFKAIVLVWAPRLIASFARVGVAGTALALGPLAILGAALAALLVVWNDLAEGFRTQSEKISEDVSNTISRGVKEEMEKAKAALEQGLADLDPNKINLRDPAVGPFIMFKGPLTAEARAQMERDLAAINRALGLTGDAANDAEADIQSLSLEARDEAYARGLADMASGAEDFQQRQSEAFDKALEDQRQFSRDALSAIVAFRTAIEEAYTGAISAQRDAAVTALSIGQKQLELTQLDKDYKENLAKLTPLEIQEYRIRRQGIIDEVNALKLHLALIGDDIQKRTALTSLLTSADMERGLTDKHDEIRASFERLRDETIASLAELARKGGPEAKGAAAAVAKFLDPKNPASPFHNAKTWGGKTIQEYINGLLSMGPKLNTAVHTILGNASIYMRADSPPGPESPLHEVDVWGERTGRAWLEGLVKAIGQTVDEIRSPLAEIGRSMAAGFTPRLAVAGLPSSFAAPPGLAGGAVAPRDSTRGGDTFKTTLIMPGPSTRDPFATFDRATQLQRHGLLNPPLSPRLRPPGMIETPED